WSINIGVRHILPTYPFFICIAAAGAGIMIRKYYFLIYLLIVILLFHAFTAWRTAPNYIAFGNDLWGGTNNTHNLLDNSNVDWGQNLKIVAQYIETENINDCWLASPGMGELVRSYQPCHLMPAPGWTATEQVIEPLPPVIEGTVFLSSAVLPPQSTVFESITKTPPITILGGSIFVYQGRFEIPLASALSYVALGSRHIRFKQFDEAIADGQKAIELAPNDPRTHLYMGNALVMIGKSEPARLEFERVLILAQTNPDLYSFEQQQASHSLLNLR
ncbi:MAG: tetratricopeptide repeat protein, partial [Pyrinomonadaceae bacterium]